jgi:hypothetical protein
MQTYIHIVGKLPSLVAIKLGTRAEIYGSSMQLSYNDLVDYCRVNAQIILEVENNDKSKKSSAAIPF